MDSLEAMEHIERIFLTVNSSEWLPQWSFDFWIIPYMMGKGVSRKQFHEFMSRANQLLKLEIATMEREEKVRIQQEYMRDLIGTVRRWEVGM